MLDIMENLDIASRLPGNEELDRHQLEIEATLGLLNIGVCFNFNHLLIINVRHR